MKAILASIILGISVLSIPLFTGCTTTGGGGIGHVITPTRVKAVAYLGTALALQQHPEYRQGFVLAVSELKLIETQDKIDFATVLAIIHRLPVKQLEGQNAVLYITAATLLLDDLGGSLDLSKVEKVKPYVIGLREGIELGLVPGAPTTSLRPNVERRLSALESKERERMEPWRAIEANLPVWRSQYSDVLQTNPFTAELRPAVNQ